MTTFRTLGSGGPMPYIVPVTTAPLASMLDGYHGLIDQGATLDVYWTQPSSGARAVTSGQVGLAFGAATPGDNASLRIAGLTDIAHALSTPLVDGNNCVASVSITFPIPAGRDTFVVFVADPVDVDSPPTINGAGFLDLTASGAAMVAPVGTVLTVGAIVEFTPLRGHPCHPASVTVIVP